MMTVAVSCNWIFAMALATPIPESHLSCFTTCSALLPRAPSLIDTFEAASLMPNYQPKTKWHWALACGGLQPALPAPDTEVPPLLKPALPKRTESRGPKSGQEEQIHAENV